MATARRASLLDDPFFLAELDRIDLPTRVSARKPPSVDDVDDVEDVKVPRTRLAPRHHSGTTQGTDGTGSARRILLGLAGFLLMMGLGAASAALVFSDRVAVLLAR